MTARMGKSHRSPAVGHFCELFVAGPVGVTDDT
jgi:hypothetical protein